jgi:hypothetical protein
VGAAALPGSDMTAAEAPLRKSALTDWRFTGAASRSRVPRTHAAQVLFPWVSSPPTSALRALDSDSQAVAYFLGWRPSGTSAIRMR